MDKLLLFHYKNSTLTNSSSNEKQLKLDKEQEMKEEWLKSNDTGEMPIFEYYTFENWMLINCFGYAICFSQSKLDTL